jgi:tRNA(Ile)-lysidine synthase
MGKTTFTSDHLLQQLMRHPDAVPCYHVAYSGGLDSHVLLHALCALRDQLDARVAAVHVHHGLQTEADRWEAHCRNVCTALDIDFNALSVDARPDRGESPEAAARTARYGALASWLPAKHCLLTAQHQDDQAETLLLQLLRGSGVDGMAAMPETGGCGAGVQLRPLLGFTRAALQDYASRHGLVWIEDPSNRDTAFDRNFLRHRVMPVLHERWPAASASLSRSAAHCAAASELMSQQAEADLQALHGTRSGTVSARGLAALSVARRDNTLRAWLKRHSRHPPSTAVLARVVGDVLNSREDAGPCVRWDRFEVRRYRDDVYCLVQRQAVDTTAELNWMLSDPLTLPGGFGRLTATPVHGTGLRRTAVTDAGVRVAWRRGGERCHPPGREHHHSLKKLFQAEGIPPWERDRIPLIYIGDQLAMIPGFWVCEPFRASADEDGIVIDWQRHE